MIAKRHHLLWGLFALSGSSAVGLRWYSSPPPSSNGGFLKSKWWLKAFPKRLFAEGDQTKSPPSSNPHNDQDPNLQSPKEEFDGEKLFKMAKKIIQQPFQFPDRLPIQGLQEFVESIPTRLGRPDLTEKLSELAGKVPNPAEVANVLKKFLTPEELKALTSKLVTDATDKALDLVFEGRLVKRIRDQMNDVDKHPELALEANVRLGTDLSEEELQYLKKRRVVVAKALTKVLGETVDPADVPVIGIAASGGGCRAMVSTIGAVKSLHRLGLLDACTYMAGVSGSTWAMAQMYGVEKSAKSALDHTKWALSRNLMNPLDFFDSFTGPMSELVLTGAVHRFHSPPKVKAIGVVDLFGALLTSKFLIPQSALSSGASLEEARKVTASKLSQQKDIVEDQTLPFPIYSAVTRVFSDEAKQKGDIYQWMEFTPFEVGFSSHTCPKEGYWIPSWAFGRSFEEGKTKDRVPETDIGIMLGVFGSAFSADFLRIIDEVEDILSEETRRRLKIVFKERMEVHPIAPATFPNPAYRIKGAQDPIAELPSIPIMDSGMDNSIPFAPLLREERNLDIIIVVDGSKGIGAHPFLARAESFAERRSVALNLPHGVKAPCVVEGTTVAEQTVRSGPAGIVYIPLVQNDTFEVKGFDPAEAAFAATHNFNWTEDEVEVVAKLIGHNVEAVQDDMKSLIRKVIREKRQRRLSGMGQK
ncbi:hypothetical protein HDU97_000987 [Phlyctochytrium planicorne]|nr:hypothetical protein HDU97_000987 [Phlyctochytrium planicorne]